MSTSNDADDTSYREFRSALDELERVGQEGGTRDFAAATEARAADPVAQFCAVWPTARRVIELILRLPFVPSGAKTVLRGLLGAGDAICKAT